MTGSFFLRDWVLLNLNDGLDYLCIHRFWDVPANRLEFCLWRSLNSLLRLHVHDLKVIIWSLLSVCYSQWRNTCIRGSKLSWSKLGSVLLKLRSFSKNSSLPDYTPWIFLQSCYHLSITKLLMLLVVIIFPLLLLYYSVLCLLFTGLTVLKQSNASKKIWILVTGIWFFIFQERRENVTVSSKVLLLTGTFVHYFCACFTLDIGLIICHWVRSFIIPHGHRWSTSSQ